MQPRLLYYKHMGNIREADELARQAAVFGAYLINAKQLDQKAVELYGHALAMHPGTLTAGEQRLLAFAVKGPWRAGLVDAGLAVVQPDSEIRRRVYIMLSILEAIPAYADAFLTQERSRWYLPVFIATGVKGVLRTMLGVVCVKVIA